MGWQFLAERVLGDEVPFTFRCKTADWRCKRIASCLSFGCSALGIQKTEEKTRGEWLTVGLL